MIEIGGRRSVLLLRKPRMTTGSFVRLGRIVLAQALGSATSAYCFSIFAAGLTGGPFGFVVRATTGRQRSGAAAIISGVDLLWPDALLSGMLLRGCHRSTSIFAYPVLDLTLFHT